MTNERMTKLKTPRLPVEFKSTTGIKNNKRQQLRARLMASAFPRVRFSAANTNPLGIKQAKILGIPGAGLPHAIYQKVEGTPNTDILERIRNGYKRHKSNLGYIKPTQPLLMLLKSSLLSYLKQ